MRARLGALVTAAVLVAVLGACGNEPSDSAGSGGAGSSTTAPTGQPSGDTSIDLPGLGEDSSTVPPSTTVPPPPSKTAPTKAPSSSEPGKPTAADVRAPFDPCKVLRWADFPQVVRHKKNKPPRLSEVDKDDVFETGCVYDNTVFSVGENDSSTEYFGLLVAWGPQLRPATYTNKKKWHPTSYSGKRAVVTSQSISRGNEQCTTIVQLGRGGIGMTLTNGRFMSQIDTCKVLRRMATFAAARTH